MKKILLLIICTCSLSVFGQKYMTEKSSVKFFSSAAVEDIAATNIMAIGMFDLETSEIAFSIPITEFKFVKSLMREHFNEKYMESEKFSKSTFQGKITGYQRGIVGSQAATATGKLTIHGVTRDVVVPGTIEFASGQIVVKSKFIVKLVDYSITRPQLLWKNIAEQVEVAVDFTFIPHDEKK